MKLNYKPTEVVMFTDGVGHLCIAEFVDQDETTIKLKNPGFAGLVPVDKENLRIDVTPWIFRGFIADSNAPTYWTVPKDEYSWVEGQIWDHRVVGTYNNQFEAKKDQPKTYDKEPETPAPVGKSSIAQASRVAEVLAKK